LDDALGYDRIVEERIAVWCANWSI
jgi:hypothetical protein